MRFSGDGCTLSYTMELDPQLQKKISVTFDTVQSFYDWLNDDWLQLRLTHTAWITRIDMGITVLYPCSNTKFKSIETSDHDEQERDQDQRKKPPY